MNDEKIIPFKLVEGIILIKGKSGSEGYFAFDTGALETTLHQKYVTGGKASDITLGTFQNSTQSRQAMEIDEITLMIEDIPYKATDINLIDMDYVEEELRLYEPSICFLGSLGGEFIRKDNFIIDYPNQRLILNPSQKPPVVKSVPMDTELLPRVDLMIGDKTYKFILDTGANAFVMDSESAPEEYIRPTNDPEAPDMITALTFAGKEFKEVEGMVTDLSAFKEKLPMDGIIGYQVLENTCCCFNFSEKKVEFF